eukprot:TRINITY_DN20478_c1_g1_i1.p1 TRINITY_DN20478_c1_g1~~TRINITY_DN20478_c1_g1_i1.p1  ORF type:complete len:637 (-),score=127.12 TRINITY_DN20478_c1_g1_i1:151-2061(-)
MDGGTTGGLFADGGEPPPKKGEVVCVGEGKMAIVTRAYPTEDKYAVKAIGANQEIKGPDGSFFYFKRIDLKRAAVATQQQQADAVNSSGGNEPPIKQPRNASSASASAPATSGNTSIPGMDVVKQTVDGLFAGPRRQEGRVKWYSKDKGFGKIVPAVAKGQSTDEEVFIHKNQIEGGPNGPHAQAISEGTLVTYELTTQDGKPCACAVQVEGVARMLARIDATASVNASDAASAAMAPPGQREELLRRLLISGLHCGTFQEKGVGKATMEDRFLARSGVTVDSLGAACRKAVCAFFGVFDGHSGASCSDFVSSSLDRSVFDCLRHQSRRDVTSEMAIRSALLSAFRTTEHNYFQYLNRLDGGAALAWGRAGSTACSVTIFGPDEEGRLRLGVANAGDSRAVLGKRDGRAIRLSEDHQPNVPGERKRIEQEGGAVTQLQGIWRIVLPSKKGLGTAGLSVSRGFGDLEYKQPVVIVSPVPEISFRVLDLREDSFIIIGSDGIWNSVQDNEATRIVASGLREAGESTDASRTAAQLLVEEAHRRDGSDDKTVLVIWFGDLPDGSVTAPGVGATLPYRRAAHSLTPTQFLGSRGGTADDIFAENEAAANAALSQPKAELAELDDLFASYALEMGERRSSR